VHQEYVNLCHITAQNCNGTGAGVDQQQAGWSARNRYTDILPAEATRVKLVSNDECDYINANQVEYQSQALQIKQIICTQSPLPETFNEFWLLVWQQKCPVICMLHRLRERGKVTGDMYWPACSHHPNLYGDICVTLVECHHFHEFSIEVRHFSLAKEDEQRTIYQLHYLGWPDFCVPALSFPIRVLVHMLAFYSQKAATQSGLQGPPVVHCSAGVGRTGTFVAIFTVMQSTLFTPTSQSKDFREQVRLLNNMQKAVIPGYHMQSLDQFLESFLRQFNIKDLVLVLRQQRNCGMVQTAEQYQFIYHTLKEELICPSDSAVQLPVVSQPPASSQDNETMTMLCSDKFSDSGKHYKPVLLPRSAPTPRTITTRKRSLMNGITGIPPTERPLKRVNSGVNVTAHKH